MNFYFDARDVFRAPRLAFSGKKIWLFLKANLFGFTVYWLVANIALVISGYGFSNSIDQFGLYPCLFRIEEPPLVAYITYFAGITIWIMAILYACTGVARLTIQQLKGNDSYSVNDTRKFIKEHRLPIMMSSVSVIAIALFFIAIAAFFGLLGKIPLFGEILFALLYVIYFFGAVFTIYTLIVFMVSFIYSPAIIATMEEDTMGTVFQSYSVTWSQPWRIIAYNSILIPVLGINIYILKSIWIAAYKFINLIFGMDWLMGEKVRNIVAWASDLVIPNITLFSNYQGPLAIASKVHHIPPTLQDGMVLPMSEYFAGTLLAMVFFILLVILLSYGLSILAVGQTLIFTIIKKKSNDENLLERPDKDSIIIDEKSVDNEEENRLTSEE